MSITACKKEATAHVTQGTDQKIRFALYPTIPYSQADSKNSVDIKCYVSRRDAITGSDVPVWDTTIKKMPLNTADTLMLSHIIYKTNSSTGIVSAGATVTYFNFEGKPYWQKSTWQTFSLSQSEHLFGASW